MNKKLNHLYSMNTFFYLSLIASMLSFVSVFLLDKGFSNSTIGTVLSVSSLLAILIQSLEANFLDKYSNFRLQDGLLINVLIILFGSILLLFTSNPLILVLFILLIFSISQASETLINSLAFVKSRFLSRCINCTIRLPAAVASTGPAITFLPVYFSVSELR